MENRTRQQYNYHNWANKRIFNHLKELPGRVYDREIKSVFSSVEEVVVHIYRTDGMWLSVMSGDPFEETMTVINKLKENVAGQDLEGMEKLYSEMSRKYDEFFEGQDDLDTVITIEHPKYGKLDAPISSLVHHVVNHGTYHRGNITAMLRQQGHEGVPTDFIFYLYEKDK
ncbi:DinB family protein [Aliifodinibius sp. S!AR15-10]|uniref:DinB family protein n=1 Tax=Aliifodinibius sp. S!AR15-10 TaxID=2950437 RepID=UPI0028660B1B|nr:DinB family protein [Aliifodinibius sp. S!AR15-10]MDR8391390.1 DinB family protein [Aliifodinibius sp. S!AR15-10]